MPTLRVRNQAVMSERVVSGKPRVSNFSFSRLRASGNHQCSSAVASAEARPDLTRSGCRLLARRGRTSHRTAYRQRVLACAAALAQGPRRPRDLKASIPDAAKILHGKVNVGLVGYVFQQVTGDHGPGASLGAFESSVASVGPQLNFFFPVSEKVQGYVNVKAYYEFAHDNRPDGVVRATTTLLRATSLAQSQASFYAASPFHSTNAAVRLCL